MCIYNPAIIPPDPIWNDGAWTFFEEGRRNKKNSKMSSDNDQFLVQNYNSLNTQKYAVIYWFDVWITR